MKCNEINVRVRYQETDQMGIVYYSNYFVYFEMALLRRKNSGNAPTFEGV